MAPRMTTVAGALDTQRPPLGAPWPAASRVWRWALVGLLAWWVSACASATAPPPARRQAVAPEAVASIVGIVTVPVRWQRPELGTLMITYHDGYHDGPGRVGIQPTTAMWLHTSGQLQPMEPADIQVGDRVTIRVRGLIFTSSPTQMTAAEIIVVR